MLPSAMGADWDDVGVKAEDVAPLVVLAAELRRQEVAGEAVEAMCRNEARRSPNRHSAGHANVQFETPSAAHERPGEASLTLP
jgi:hypothetical protein